ncbi:hypothetical protein AAVH_07753 [Aphelenchoides avenae]|nr:hypothetical protein AAVH_07753 [Aphelenchus avenae]
MSSADVMEQADPELDVEIGHAALSASSMLSLLTCISEDPSWVYDKPSELEVEPDGPLKGIFDPLADNSATIAEDYSVMTAVSEVDTAWSAHSLSEYSEEPSETEVEIAFEADADDWYHHRQYDEVSVEVDEELCPRDNITELPNIRGNADTPSPSRLYTKRLDA